MTSPKVWTAVEHATEAASVLSATLGAIELQRQGKISTLPPATLLRAALEAATRNLEEAGVQLERHNI